MKPLLEIWNDYLCTFTGAEEGHQYSSGVLLLAALVHLEELAVLPW